jgi:hypothetical protein
MKYFEGGGFCPLEEYRASEDDRLMPPELVIDELYMLMMAIRNGAPDQQAIKKISKVPSRENAEEDLHRVKFNILDDDLRCEVQVTGQFRDGYWIDSASKITIAKRPVENGYFRSCSDAMDRGLRLLIEDSIPSRLH